MLGLKLTAAPSVEPVTLTEAKLHCKVDDSADDTLLTALIVAARQMAEAQTGRALVTQSWELKLDEFPIAAIDVPLPPLQSVQSVKYVDTAGALQTLAAENYQVFITGLYGLITPAHGASWPEPRDQPEAVTVAFTAGYGAAAAVPQAIKQWILLQVGHWYANRESSGEKREPLPFVDALLDPYRLLRF